MYVPARGGGEGLGNFEVVARGDELHLFHVVLPAADRVAHLVSRDGLAWRRLPDALRIGPPGRFDDGAIVAIAVVRGAGTHHMLYEARAAERGSEARIGSAQSDDLVHWRPMEHAVQAAAHLYAPKTTRVGEREFRTVAATFVADAPLHRRAAIAVHRSREAAELGPRTSAFAPRSTTRLQSPQLFTVAGDWYLTASVPSESRQRYWVGASADGPWRAPDRDQLLPSGLDLVRVFSHAGRLACIGRFADESGGAVLGPAELTHGGDGALVARRWNGWDARRGTATHLGPPTPSWEDGPPTSSLSAPFGTAMWHWGDPGSCFELEVTLEADATRFGVALGLDRDGGALLARFDRGAQRVTLVEARGETRVIQSSPWSGRPRPQVRLRRWADAIEMDVDGVVVLAAVAPTRRGRLGIVVESGTAEVTHARLFNVDPPITT
ncbi:MAG: hypothetical protein AAF721_12615 [Myxococcota bacterium]